MRCNEVQSAWSTSSQKHLVYGRDYDTDNAKDSLRSNKLEALEWSV